MTALEVNAVGEPTDAADEAMEQWHDEILIWGRKGWRQVGRLCRNAVTMAGGSIPGLDCPAAPPDE